MVKDIRKFAYTNIAYQGAAFLWKYSPNLKEIIVNLFFKATIETIFASQLAFLTQTGNPGTPSVLRDAIMTPGVVVNSITHQEISKTGITYDEFSIWGTISRGVCKGALLYSADTVEYGYNTTISSFGYNNTDATNKYDLAANVGGFICDYGSLIANSLSKAKQLEIKDTIHQAINKVSEDQRLEILQIFKQEDIKAAISRTTFTELFKNLNKMPLDSADISTITNLKNENWLSYTVSHFSFSTIKEIVPGAIIRSTIGYHMNKFIQWGRNLDAWVKPYYFLDGQKNKLISAVFNIPELDSNDQIWTQITKIHQETKGPKAILVDSVILICGAGYRLGVEIVQAPIQITPVRAGYALVEYGMKEYPMLTLFTISTATALYSSKAALQEYATNITSSINDMLSSNSEQVCIGANCLIDLIEGN